MGYLARNKDKSKFLLYQKSNKIHLIALTKLVLDFFTKISLCNFVILVMEFIISSAISKYAIKSLF